MKKRKYTGRDFWECDTCSFTTFNAGTAKEHTEHPV